MGDPLQQTLHETVIILDETVPGTLQILCPFCDPCDGFKTVQFNLKSILKIKSFFKITQDVVSDMPAPYAVSLFAPGYTSQAFRPSFQILMKVFRLIDLRNLVSNEESVANFYITSQIFDTSTNITIMDADKNSYEWNDVIIKACSSTRTISSHPKLRPAIYKSSKPYFQLHQDIGYVLESREMRFVSCHEEHLVWTEQLLELISPFDKATWALLIVYCVILSCFITFTEKSLGKIFLLVMSLLEYKKIYNQYRTILRAYLVPKVQ